MRTPEEFKNEVYKKYARMKSDRAEETRRLRRGLTSLTLGLTVFVIGAVLFASVFRAPLLLLPYDVKCEEVAPPDAARETDMVNAGENDAQSEQVTREDMGDYSPDAAPNTPVSGESVGDIGELRPSETDSEKDKNAPDEEIETRPTNADSDAPSSSYTPSFGANAEMGFLGFEGNPFFGTAVFSGGEEIGDSPLSMLVRTVLVAFVLVFAVVGIYSLVTVIKNKKR